MINKLKSKPAASIIVPVYNVARYLERCLDSIRNQSRGDFEVILVPNGERDDDLKICKKYVEMDPRFSLITLRKKGAGRARNAGIDAASSEYIMFVDGDDTVEFDFVEKMLAPVENDPSVDMVQCGVNIIFDGNIDKGLKDEQNEYYKSVKGKHIANDLVCTLNVTVWSKLFRKSLIEKYKIKIPNDLYGEDNYFTRCYLSVCNNVFCIENKTYNYLNREESIMWNTRRKRIGEKSLDALTIGELIYYFWKQNDVFEKFEMEFFVIYDSFFHFSQWCSTPSFQKRIRKKVASFLKKEKLEIPNLSTYDDLRDVLNSQGTGGRLKRMFAFIRNAIKKCGVKI